MNCPKCSSPNYASNHIPLPSGEIVGRLFGGMRKAGHPVVAGIGGAAWLLSKLANHHNAAYRCRDCGYEFDA